MIAQLGIATLGVAAVWLSQDPRPAVRRYACLFGLAGQPFWFYATWSSEQWGMFALCFLYSWAWFTGLRQHWLSRQADEAAAPAAHTQALRLIASVSPSLHITTSGERRCCMCLALIDEARTALGKPAWSSDQKEP